MKDWSTIAHIDQPDQLHTLFSRLNPQDVEDFYTSYHQWLTQQRIQLLQAQIQTIQQKICENTQQMAVLRPSSIVHATLSRLRARGVEDIELLDRLLEHDDCWLDHTIQLLEQCERLNLIPGSYPQWCERALEGAYDWVESITISDQSENTANTSPMTPLEPESASTTIDTLPQVTEEELLQKLMTEDDDETVKLPAASSIPQRGAITRPLI